MSGMQFDASELRRLAVDLGKASVAVTAGVAPIIVKGAVQIKTQMRNEMAASTSFKGVTPAITFVVVTRADGIEARIGPKRGKPGSLANIAYFGGSRGGGTVPDPQGALDKEAPNVERAISELIGRFL